VPTERWEIVGDPDVIELERRAGAEYLWRIVRGDETRVVTVFFSLEVLEDGELIEDVLNATRTRGYSVVETLLDLDDPPGQMLVTTKGSKSARRNAEGRARAALPKNLSLNRLQPNRRLEKSTAPPGAAGRPGKPKAPGQAIRGLRSLPRRQAAVGSS
jgi:hypothetical protein